MAEWDGWKELSLIEFHSKSILSFFWVAFNVCHHDDASVGGFKLFAHYDKSLPTPRHEMKLFLEFSMRDLIKSDLLKRGKNGDLLMWLCGPTARNVSFWQASHLTSSANTKRRWWRTNDFKFLATIARMISWRGHMDCLRSVSVRTRPRAESVRRSTKKTYTKWTSSQNGFIQIQFIKDSLINLSMTSQIYDGENGIKTRRPNSFLYWNLLLCGFLWCSFVTSSCSRFQSTLIRQQPRRRFLSVGEFASLVEPARFTPASRFIYIWLGIYQK